MHYKNGFKDRNFQRYMLETRVKKLINKLREKYWYTATMDASVFDVYFGEAAYEDLADLSWESFDGKNDRWGGENSNVWFHQTFTLPDVMQDKPVVYAMQLKSHRWIDTSGWYWGTPQVLAYVNGQPVSGMDVNHQEILLSAFANAGDVYKVELCAFTDRFFYSGKVGMNACVCAINQGVQALYYDMCVPLEVAETLPEDDARRIDIIQYLNTAVSMIDFRLPAGELFDDSVQKARDYLEHEFYTSFCGHEDIVVTCVGHTHIDTAWLWTLDQTRKKVQRSFSTALDLLNRYESFKFMSSQPQLYAFMKEALPEQYEKIRAHIAAGRWEAEGGMWVEADTNIPCGESLVRQFLYGKQFFKNEFNVDNRILWLPDVFGYSGALPQIMKRSGIDYFMTTKMSWNEYNKFPYDTFLWRGIDGSEVLVHFICTQHCGQPSTEHLTTYNGHLSPAYVIGTWNRYHQKNLNRNVLFSFGYGDGGGGPNTEMMEFAQRMERGIPGCPKVKIDTPLNYFRCLEEEVSDNPKLPVWVGESYLEYHRGTYTSIAEIKKNMRKNEILLQAAELFGCIARQIGVMDSICSLLNAWTLLLLNQFHDILPGTSIREVYEESETQFALIQSEAEGALFGALDCIAHGIGLDEDSLVVFNSTTFIRNDIAEFRSTNTDVAIYDGETRLPSQCTAEGTILFQLAGVPAKGYKTFALRTATNAEEKSVTAVIDGRHFDTNFFSLSFDNNGAISSLFSKKQCREFAQPGNPLNRLIALEDVPPVDDAWNINAYINEKTWTIDYVDNFSIVENGPIRCVIRIARRFMSSVIVQDVILYSGIDRIDVKNHIDWKEHDILLKADFPFPVNAMRATFDIQFGNIERTTHNNTSWDFAQFEVCAHRWADLSEETYGLSILNDCKYGYDIKKGHIRLTLIKSATYPNPTADNKVHEFVYSIYPHAGTWRQSDTVRQAALLNCPAYTVEQTEHGGGNLPTTYSFVSCPDSNIILDTVKPAEDGNGIILRLYENNNKTTVTVLTFYAPLREACLCDLMENIEQPVTTNGNQVTVSVKPYQIVTLRLAF